MRRLFAALAAYQEDCDDSAPPTAVAGGIRPAGVSPSGSSVSGGRGAGGVKPIDPVRLVRQYWLLVAIAAGIGDVWDRAQIGLTR